QGLVHDGDRPDTANSLLECRACGRLAEAPGLQPQQGGDGLQVVLDTMMDLPDRRVLRQQLTLPPAQLRHVVGEDEGAGAIAFRSQRDGAKLDESLVCLDLDLPWSTTTRHHLHRLVDRARD